MKYARLAILFIFASCSYFQNDQQRAEGLAKRYLDSALKGSENYEIVKSSPIDTLRDGPDDEPGYQLISKKIDSTYTEGDSLAKALAVSTSKDKTTIQNLLQKNYEKRNTLLHQSLQYMLNYKGKPNGWILEQTYRLKNDDHASLCTLTFKLDSNLSKVWSQQGNLK